NFHKIAAILLSVLLLSGCGLELHKHSPFNFGASSADPDHAEKASPESLDQDNTGNLPVVEEDTGKPSTALQTINAPDPEAPVPPAQNALDEALDFCKAAQDFWQQGELENAIQALDQAYALLLEGEDAQTPELIQQKEDLRFLISKRILEIYASRNRVVNGDHKAIPIKINDEVQREIDRFTKGRDRAFFINSYKRSGQYRGFIVERLKEAGLPEELSWLPLIESGFKPRALSPARALGLWQFIPSTGYKFGLERNVYIDERLDPEKSTEAAVKYLTALHNIFGDWCTVLAAYNSGEGRVLRKIREQRINYLDDFWDLYQKLPRETAQYVPKFLATLHIVSNLEKYNLDDIEPLPPMSYETVALPKQVHLKEIARAIDVPLKELKALNPVFRHQIVPGENYLVKIPEQKEELLLAEIDSLPTTSAPQRQFVYHRVRRGEALSTIARRYRTSVANIARANNIYRHNYIKAGRLLKIPVAGNWAKTTPPASYNTASATEHVVKRGESLWILARRYGTTVNAIQRVNGLSSSRLSIGQVLKLPGQGGSDSKTYLVQPGDSPFTIATRHKIPLQQFLRMNKLTKNSTIYPGQKVFVK
ncbi:MAG: LysM peptidoglycan-binding domain-containing protein, partial [Desulfosudaceae bacterium]